MPTHAINHLLSPGMYYHKPVHSPMLYYRHLFGIEAVISTHHYFSTPQFQYQYIVPTLVHNQIANITHCNRDKIQTKM